MILARASPFNIAIRKMCVKNEEFGLQIGGILRRFSRPGLTYICTKVA